MSGKEIPLRIISDRIYITAMSFVLYACIVEVAYWGLRSAKLPQTWKMQIYTEKIIIYICIKIKIKNEKDMLWGNKQYHFLEIIF